MTDAIDGVPLNDLLRREGALPAERVRRIGVRLATTLAALHDAGYVHGDLRPSRVLLDGDEAWILAYGLAREGDGAPTLLASPAYLSPQLLRGASPTAADDVWSLGVLLTTMLQGTPPFAGRTAAEVLAATGDAATPAVDAWPAPLGGLVGAMLARDPAERPAASRARRQLEAPAAAASQRPGTHGERRGDGRSRGVALPLLAIVVVLVIVALVLSRL